jgi:hypothetical protein
MNAVETLGMANAEILTSKSTYITKEGKSLSVAVVGAKLQRKT